jgi:hypothetical protein
MVVVARIFYKKITVSEKRKKERKKNLRRVLSLRSSVMLMVTVCGRGCMSLSSFSFFTRIVHAYLVSKKKDPGTLEEQASY